MDQATESGERMTDGKGRRRWEINQGELGVDEPKNVREPERVVGSLACRRFEFSATRLGFDGSVP